MNKKIKLIAALLCCCSTFESFAQTWTSSLGACTQTGGNGVITEGDKLKYNRITIQNDENKAVVFRCLVNLRSDKAITKIQIDVTADTAAQVIDYPADHSDMLYYLPSCRLEISYNPGGGDYVPITPAKSVPWGHYDRLEVSNPTVQYAGNGYAQNAILQCQSAYYSDVTRFYGLRITYAD